MMRFLTLLTIAIILSGCASRIAVIGGISDMIEIKKGTVITGVSLPTTEDGKLYDIVVQKDSFLVSKDGVNRYQKAKVGQ